MEAPEEQENTGRAKKRKEAPPGTDATACSNSHRCQYIKKRRKMDAREERSQEGDCLRSELQRSDKRSAPGMSSGGKTRKTIKWRRSSRHEPRAEGQSDPRDKGRKKKEPQLDTGPKMGRTVLRIVVFVIRAPIPTHPSGGSPDHSGGGNVEEHKTKS